jgi:hypothetical protein
MTERTAVTFSTKRGSDNKPFIVLEAVGEPLSIQESGFISFDLKDGVTDQEAEQIRAFLDEKLVHVCFTRAGTT